MESEDRLPAHAVRVADAMVRSQAAAVVAGPALLAVSTFYWRPDGGYGVLGGTLVAASLGLWVFGLLGLCALLGAVLPRVGAGLGLLTAVGGASGVAFGVRGFYDEVFQLDQQASVAVTEAHPWASAVLFYWTGPLFPLAVTVLGLVVLVVAPRALRWTGPLLVVAGIGFPVSRTLRMVELAHVVDLLLLVGFTVLAVAMWRGRFDRAGLVVRRVGGSTTGPASSRGAR